VGLGGRRPRARDSRSPGAAGEDHAAKRRRDPSLGRLPRRPDRPLQGIRRRDAGPSRSATRSAPATPACSCTTAAPSRS
jgi:hypothetical protein